MSSHEAANQTTSRPPEVHRDGLDVVNVHIEGVSAELTMVGWILLASYAKLLFNLSRRLSNLLPDSALLIILGILCGLVLSYVRYVRLLKWLKNLQVDDVFYLDAHTFFLFLLPPIVFDAGYSMHQRAFFSNIGSILIFAVFGTLWNMLSIGLSLWGVSKAGGFQIQIPLLDLLVFTSIISAVDPVAVIAVFEQVHVNATLYINVFGESLLNDAVAVVLYRLFLAFVDIGPGGIKTSDYVTGCVSFFVVSIGGFLVGVVAALLTAFTTRFTHNVNVLVPVFVFLIPYLGYLVAEMFGLSAIIAIVFCALIMKPYIRENISINAASAIKYYTKMLAVGCEAVVFIFLGVALFAHPHRWDLAFIGATLLFALIFRTIGVVLLCAIVNRFRVIKFSAVDQVVMSYGGLRGAIAYGLVQTLPDTVVGKDLFLTATIVLIFFTVFFQGTTVRPLVHWLKIRLEDEEEKTMGQHMFERLSDFAMAGIETIVERRGKHYLREMFRVLNAEVLRPLLVRKDQRELSSDPTFLRNLKLIEIRDVVEGLREQAGGRRGGHKVHPAEFKPPQKVHFNSEDEMARSGYFYSRNPDRSLSRLEDFFIEEMIPEGEGSGPTSPPGREQDRGSVHSHRSGSSSSTSSTLRPVFTLREEEERKEKKKKKVHTIV